MYARYEVYKLHKLIIYDFVKENKKIEYKNIKLKDFINTLFISQNNQKSV